MDEAMLAQCEMLDEAILAEAIPRVIDGRDQGLNLEEIERSVFTGICNVLNGTQGMPDKLKIHALASLLADLSARVPWVEVADDDEEAPTQSGSC